MRDGGELVFVAVGANLGDREATFAAVVRALEAELDLLLLGASTVYETDPIGPPGQGAYLNAVLGLRSWLAPLALLHRLQSIEAALGRDRARQSQRWGPRTVDLDPSSTAIVASSCPTSRCPIRVSTSAPSC